MRNIKLAELLTSLSYHEKQSFGKYLSSPFFNTDQRVTKLYDQLKSISKDDPIPDKKILFKKIFPSQAYDDKKIRYQFTYLSGHIEKFLSLREFESDEQQQIIHLQRSLSKRNTHKSYSFSRLRFETGMHYESLKNFHNSYLASELHHHYSASRFPRNKQSNYENVVAGLDRFYILRKLQLYCELINYKNVMIADHQVYLVDEIRTLITQHSFFKSKAIEIYYYILLTLTEPGTEKHFEKLRALLEKSKHLFPVEDIVDMYQYVKNYCIKMINMGNDEYRQKLFVIYKNILSDTRMMNHGYFSQWEYKNIVTLGLRLKEKKWVSDFIRRYINYIAPRERKNALTYNTAMLGYHEKNYRQTLKLLREVEFSDLYYALDSRSLLMKVYFETDDMETLLYHISAFKIFLSRNKFISDYQREIYRNYIRYTLKLFRAETNIKKLVSLKEEISIKKNISDRNWLLEKANELID